MDIRLGWFSEIGLAFAANHSEIRAAEQLFLRDRQQLLEAVRELLKTRLREADLQVVGTEAEPKWSGERVQIGLDIDCEYRRRHGGTEAQWAAAAQVIMGVNDGDVVFKTGAAFWMEKARFERIQDSLGSLRDQLGGELSGCYYGDNMAQVRFCALSPRPGSANPLTKERVLQEVDALPGLFRKAEEWFTSALRSLQ